MTSSGTPCLPRRLACVINHDGGHLARQHDIEQRVRFLVDRNDRVADAILGIPPDMAPNKLFDVRLRLVSQRPALPREMRVLRAK